MAERSAVNRIVVGSSPTPGAMSKLPDDEIAERLAALLGWEREGDEIVRTFELPTFPEAIAFVDRIAIEAEAADHHPDLDIRWRTVRVALTTHDEDGISERDFTLAATIDLLEG